MKREKIIEREDFDYDDRQTIAKKSDNKCCHCGNTVFTNYGATIDHFIPISKGGTNRLINLITLCKTCNKKKGNKIYNPREYCEYLKEEELQKLEDYFKSYIQSFEYIERTNLLACDAYKIKILTYISPGRKQNQKPIFKTYILKKAFYDDYEKITEYYIKYLKKFKLLDTEEEACKNILFWLKFACIYYYETNQEIKSLFIATVENTDPVKQTIKILVFSYYQTIQACMLTNHILTEFPAYIMKEQCLQQLPVAIGSIAADKTLQNNPRTKRLYADAHTPFAFCYKIYTNNQTEIDHTQEFIDIRTVSSNEKTNNFFKKFKNIRKEADIWAQRHNASFLPWLCKDLLGYTDEEAQAEIQKQKKD